MKWWIVVMVVGAALIASGAGVGAKSAQPGEITCGSDVMGPGDVCEETRRGVTVDTYTYEEKVQEEKDSAATFARSGRWVQLGIGAGLVVLSVVGIVLTRRRRAGQAAVVQEMVNRQAVWNGAQVPQTYPRQPRSAQPPHSGPYPPPPPQYQQPAPQHYPDFGPRRGN